MKDNIPAGKILKKVTLEEGVFVESAFNMRCHIVKNTLLHTAFSATLTIQTHFKIFDQNKKEYKFNLYLSLDERIFRDVSDYLFSSLVFF